jgi:P-type Cu+ transporter
MTITAPTGAAASCTLDIGGMTCASCVRRVEKSIRRVDGVATADVNLATEVATVHFDPARAGLAELTAAVGRAGYTATPRRDDRPPAGEPDPGPADDAAQLRSLRRK